MTWKRKRIQQKWNNITNRIEWFTVIERKENETKGWETNEKNKNWHSEVKRCNCSSLAIHLVSFSFSFHHRKYLSLSLVFCLWMALLGEWTLSLPQLQMQHINKLTRAPAQSDRDISKLFVSNALSVCARGEQSPRKAVYVSANRICGQCTPNAPNRTWNIRDGSLSSHFSLPGIASNCIVSLFPLRLHCCAAANPSPHSLQCLRHPLVFAFSEYCGDVLQIEQLYLYSNFSFKNIYFCVAVVCPFASMLMLRCCDEIASKVWLCCAVCSSNLLHGVLRVMESNATHKKKSQAYVECVRCSGFFSRHGLAQEEHEPKNKEKRSAYRNHFKFRCMRQR